jgi:hypothetical protein
LKDIDKKLPMDELESLFCVVEKKAESQTTEASKKPTVVQLLDPRRGNNVAIMLSQFKNKFPTFAQIGQAIEDAEDEALGTSAIEVLLKYAPTSEEVRSLLNPHARTHTHTHTHTHTLSLSLSRSHSRSLVQIDSVTSYTGDMAMLGTAEKYFLEIKNVNKLEAKLKALFFKREFDSRIAAAGEELRMITEASKRVRNSKKLKGVFEVILAVGNYMNATNSRGGAYGFGLDTLKKVYGPGRQSTLHDRLSHIRVRIDCMVPISLYS